MHRRLYETISIEEIDQWIIYIARIVRY